MCNAFDRNLVTKITTKIQKCTQKQRNIIFVIMDPLWPQTKS